MQGLIGQAADRLFEAATFFAQRREEQREEGKFLKAAATTTTTTDAPPHSLSDCAIRHRNTSRLSREDTLQLNENFCACSPRTMGKLLFRLRTAFAGNHDVIARYGLALAQQAAFCHQTPQRVGGFGTQLELSPCNGLQKQNTRLWQQQGSQICPVT